MKNGVVLDSIYAPACGGCRFELAAPVIPSVGVLHSWLLMLILKKRRVWGPPPQCNCPPRSQERDNWQEVLNGNDTKKKRRGCLGCVGRCVVGVRENCNCPVTAVTLVIVPPGRSRHRDNWHPGLGLPPQPTGVHPETPYTGIRQIYFVNRKHIS